MKKFFEHNNTYLIITSFVALFSLFFSFNVNITYAGNDGTSGNNCGASCLSFNHYWKKTNFRSRRETLPLLRKNGTIVYVYVDNFFNNSLVTTPQYQVDDFLNSPDQWILSRVPGEGGGFFYLNNESFNWGSRSVQVSYPFEGRSVNRSIEIYQEVIDKRGQRFKDKGFAVYGKFPVSSNLCTETVCTCEVGSGPKRKSLGREHSSFEADKVKVSGDYSYQITITPVKPIGFEKLSKEEQAEWLATHKSQKTEPKLTAFGEFVRNYNYNNFSGQIDSQKLWDEFKRQAEQKSKEEIKTENINLSEENLKGFQRGGAFTITTNVKKVTISGSVTTDYIGIYDCIKGSDGKGHYQLKSKVASRTLVSEPNSGGVSKSINFDTIGGYTPKYSYQIINVRCNRNYFSDLVRNTKSTITSGSKNLSSSAQSPLVENGIATFYNNLDTIFFYDGKDCIFKCSASPTGQSAGPNDASNNIQNRGNNQTKYGAQTIDGNSNDSFSFFRDNIFKVVRVDVWHPIVDNNEMSYNADTPAYKTKFILRKAGTPRAELFSVTDESGNVILKDFPTNSTLTLNGQRNKFGYQGGYASEKDKEHRTNLRFTYSVNTKISVPTLNVYGVVSSTDYDTEALDVTCYTTFNTTVPQRASVAHGPKANNYKDNSDFNNEDNKTLKVGFVKASAE